MNQKDAKRDYDWVMSLDEARLRSEALAMLRVIDKQTEIITRPVYVHVTTELSREPHDESAHSQEVGAR